MLFSVVALSLVAAVLAAPSTTVPPQSEPDSYPVPVSLIDLYIHMDFS